MTVYMCEPWLEGILCGVYDAWSDPAGHENVRLAVKGEYEELELFAEYRDVQICPEKAEKVIRSVCAKLSQEIYRKVYTASLSQRPHPRSLFSCSGSRGWFTRNQERPAGWTAALLWFSS